MRGAEFGTLQRARKLLASLTAALSATVAIGLHAQALDENGTSKSLAVLNYVTGWTHDAIGYHPAVFMLLENVSGRDLSNKAMRFQARFTDLHTAEVTIGRSEFRNELKPHQQFRLALEGNQAYELPFELYQWPSIEAKVMCRIGSVGDEGTETLTIAKVDSVARTAAEAFETLNQSTAYNPSARPVAHSAGHQHVTHTARPVAAKPERASVPALAAAPPQKTTETPAASSPLTLLNSKSLPGLGDDFYNFEQRFGLPQSTDAKRPEWTWAKYKHTGTGAEIIAGAKDRSGKVDVIVMKMPKGGGVDEVQLVNAARQMSGKFKSQPISTPAKSVRYLPSGRLELVSSTSSGYKIVCMAPDAGDSDNSFILVLSRVQQDTDVLLPSIASKTQLLKCLKFLDGNPSD